MGQFTQFTQLYDGLRRQFTQFIQSTQFTQDELRLLRNALGIEIGISQGDSNPDVVALQTKVTEMIEAESKANPNPPSNPLPNPPQSPGA